MLHSINYCMCVFLKFICIYFFLYYRGPCVRKLFTGLIMYLPSQNNEHCIVLYCIVLYWRHGRGVWRVVNKTVKFRLAFLILLTVNRL